jgi:hypothetical protein
LDGITYGGCELLGPVAVVVPVARAVAAATPQTSRTAKTVLVRIPIPPLVDGRIVCEPRVLVGCG